GLLWHIGYIVGNVEGLPWTIDENKWLTYIKENSADIWEQIRSTQEELKETERALKKASGHASPAEDFDEIFSYIPRAVDKSYMPPEKQPYHPTYMFQRLEEDTRDEKKIKIVGVKSGKESQIPVPSVKKIE
ncbi:hypothetical protein EBT25_14615, partial [bacterium]|nr:hypothetical protein [bacterium]